MERKEGRGRPVALNSQQQERGQEETKERQPLPSVWDVLERKVRLHGELSAARIAGEEYERERTKLNRLSNERSDNRTARDNLILDLYAEIRAEPTGTLPIPVTFRELSLEEFQQLRSKVELMSNKQIVEEIRKAEEEYERKEEELFKGGGGWPPPNSIVQV
jgi:hypothetical protein